jgi:hypothetical protein
MIEQDPGSRRRFAPACPGRRASRIDFVDQLDRLRPGTGTKAVRGILHALAATPQLQRAFFGGPVVETAPFGVFEPNGPARYEEALLTRPWEPKDADETAPVDSGILEEAPAIDDGMLDPAKWPETLRAQGQAAEDEPEEDVLESDDEVELEVNEDEDEDENADPNFRARERDGSYRVASGPATTMTDASPQPAAPSRPARPSVTRTETHLIVDDPDDLRARAQGKGGWLGPDFNPNSRHCVALVQHAFPELGRVRNWRAGEQVRGPNDPPLTPGTAIATFQPDAAANGELRYPESEFDTAGKRTRRHAGIFTRYGEHNGRAGIWMVDQFDNQTKGATQERFYPFERPHGQDGHRAGHFSIIRPNTAVRP